MKTSLRKKFLITFSILIILTVISLQLWNYIQSFQKIKQDEANELELVSQSISEKMTEQLRVAEHSLLAILHSPEVNRLFADEDRTGLQQFIATTYNELESNGIDQLQFHTVDSASFLRVHQPEKYGDDLSSFRHTVVDTNENNVMIKGLEEGVAGYGFRVVAPVEYEGNHIGSVEVGTNFGQNFLESMKSSIDGDYYIYSFSDNDDTFLASTTDTDPYPLDNGIIEKLKQSENDISIYSDNKKQTIMAIPFFDYEGEMKGFIKSVISREDSLAYMNSLITNAVITGIVSLIIIFVITYYLVSSVTRPISNVSASMGRVAEKDLTIDHLAVKSNDEVGHLSTSLNTMVDNLRSTLNSVNEAAEQVAASSQQLLASADETSRASEQVSNSMMNSAERRENQLQNINEVTKTIDDMSGGLGHIMTDSEELLNKTEHVSTIVDSGQISVNNVVSQMTLINESVNDLAIVIENLDVRTNEIDQIVQFITDISDQTNLLALNAAIEAARAGEAGQGFAVVANEVRQLAEESAGSAVQIMDVIKTIKDETNQAVKVMAENSNKVNEGIEKADTVKQAFQHIEHSITDVNEFTEEVTSSFEEMSAGSEQIVHAIENIRKTAEANAENDMETSAASEQQVASMQEISSAADVLANLAVQLQQEINDFKL